MNTTPSNSTFAGGASRPVLTTRLLAISHIGRTYNLAGPRSETWSFYAGEFSEALGRPITYADIAPEAWRDRLVAWGLPSHLIDHLTTTASLTRQNRFERASDDMAALTGTPAMGLREFVQRHAAAYATSA